MDIIRDNMGIVNIFILCIIIIGIIFIRPIKHVQAQAFKIVGNSDLGTVYIDTDTVEVVKKDGQYYLIVSAEEHYKESNFLTELRKDEDLKDTVSSLTLYMFTNDGKYYCMPQRYLIDSQGKVCGDLGSNMQMQMIDDKVVSKIYTSALKSLSDKKRFQNMMRR